MRGKCSCKDCKERYSGCHSACEKYKEYRKEIDRKNANRAKCIKENAPFIDAIGKSITKKLRTKGHK